MALDPSTFPPPLLIPKIPAPDLRRPKIYLYSRQPYWEYPIQIASRKKDVAYKPEFLRTEAVILPSQFSKQIKLMIP